MANVSIQPGAVRVRHITRCLSTDAGAVNVLGSWYRGTLDGVNGVSGWQTARVTRKLGEEGDFALRFPNAVGADGSLHRDRLAIIRNGRAEQLPGGVVSYSAARGGSYRPGDEFFEIYADGEPDGGLLFVGTPTKATVTSQEITVTGWDALWLQRKAREFQAGFWNHSPRDVLEHYSAVWQAPFADDMSTVHLDRVIVRGSYARGAVSLNTSNLGEAYVCGNPARVGINWPSADLKAIRAEATINVPAGDAIPTYYVAVSQNTSTFRDLARVEIKRSGSQGTLSLYAWGATGALYQNTGIQVPLGVDHRIVIELRYGFAYFYANGTLVGVLPASGASTTAIVRVTVADPGGTDPEAPALYSTMTCKQLLIRCCRAFLLRGSERGDYRLPGAPSPGGLYASYYHGANEVAKSLPIEVMLAPTKSPIAGRVETITYCDNSTLPTGVPRQGFAARWTGAIYLDFATHGDMRFRLRAADRGRVWIGKTTGTPLVESASTVTPVYSAYMSAHLGASKTGWYPIVIEMYCPGTAVLSWLELEPAARPGTFDTIGASLLSPYGVFTDFVRNDAHYDVIRAVADSFGYQLTLEPRSLESGEFPGRMVPRVRVGSDFAITVDEPRSWAISSAIDAEGVADAIGADAAGIADPRGAAQLTAEILNFEQLGAHLFVMQGFESLSDITQRPLLEQRLGSLLALAAAPWEEVTSRSDGRRELAEPWPLQLPPTGVTGSTKLFAWRPGDALLRNFQTIGVVDTSPRQLMAVSWDANPNGLKPPAGAWRQSPRGWPDVVRQMKRTAIASSRNPQGSIVAMLGTHASNSPVVALDAFSRIPFPANPGDLVRAEFIVESKDTATAFALNVNGVERVRAVTGVGAIDITAWAAAESAIAQRVYAGLVAIAGSSGFWQGRIVFYLRA